MSQISVVHPLRRARYWQERPEFDQLCQWWRDGGQGVFALLGIGGAGKTAIVDRFLQILPGAMPEHRDVPKRTDLPVARPLLLFSFDDEPDPDAFFVRLAEWLDTLQGRTASVGSPISYHETLARLEQTAPCLLIFDGLEKIQYDGASGQAVGGLSDGRLRNLVLRIADGWLRHVSLLITTRFPLFDAQAGRASYFRQTDVTHLSVDAAIQLLGRRVPNGPPGQLEALARDQGLHALSLDLIGGYVADFCGGDLSRLSLLGEIDVSDLDQCVDPQAAAIIEQERRLAGVIARYRNALADHDPAALGLLQRLCLFRSPVTAEFLGKLFSGQERVAVAGWDLASLPRDKLAGKLARLAKMRLVDSSRHHAEAAVTVYATHPAISKAFRGTLAIDQLHSVLAYIVDYRERELDAPRTELQRWLVNRLQHQRHEELRERRRQWRTSLQDEQTRKGLEDLVWYLVQLKDWEGAFAAFQIRLGGYNWLQHIFSDCARGERITRMLQGLGGESLPGALRHGRLLQSANGVEELRQLDKPQLIHELGGPLRAVQYGRVLNDRAGFLRHLADLPSSEALYSAAEWIAGCISTEDAAIEKWIAQRNLANLHVLTGRLERAKSRANEAFTDQLKKDLPTNKENEVTRTELTNHIALGVSLGLQGAVQDATAHFEQAAQHGRELNPSPPTFIGFPGIWHADLLRRLGKRGTSEATAILNRVASTASANWQQVQEYRILMEGRVAQANGDDDACQERLDRFYKWSCNTGDEWARVSEEVTHVEWLLQRIVHDESTPSQLREELKERLNRAIVGSRRGGYGIYHIDLLLVRAELALHECRADDAIRDVTTALDEGVQPREDSGFPTLLAAADSACQYAWGIAKGHHLLGESLLLNAAHQLGRASFVTPAKDSLPEPVRALVQQAELELNEAIDWWRRLRDPQADEELHYCGVETRRSLDELGRGLLTRRIARDVSVVLQISRQMFDGLAQKQFIDELASSLKVAEETISIVELRDGSLVVVLRFENANALAHFANEYVADAASLKMFREKWRVTDVRFTAEEMDGPLDTASKGQTGSARCPRVFVSYSHEDKVWPERLEIMLSPRIRANALSLWWDKNIDAGRQWRDEITKELASADVALLVVSQYFLDSEFINNHELPYLLKAAEEQRVKLSWILIDDCLYKHTHIDNYQAAHDIAKPLAELRRPERVKALVKICEGLERLAKSGRNMS